MENNQKEIILLKDLGMEFPTSTSKRKKRFGLFKCFCGNEFITITYDVKRNHTNSCGCTTKKHKLSGHRIYGIWNAMIQRCNNINDKNYVFYGARGVTICNEWLDVAKFIKDMYPSYQEGLSIDRIDNNKGYSKDNCRWTTKDIQSRNTRKIHTTNTSGYRGVCWHKKKCKWVANISIQNKMKYLGSFEDKLEAAKAYDKYVVDNNLEHTKNFS